MTCRASLLGALVAALPVVAPAHPHIFVEAGVTVIFDGERPAAVRLDWRYDDFFSLLLTADLGIDLDGDGILTAAETETLAAAVTEWPPEFLGDLEVLQGDQPVGLAPKIDHTMTYADGLVTESHTRPLQGAEAGPLTIRVYDPFYYIAYALSGPVRIEGRADCTAAVTPPDLNRAYALVDELLYGRPASDVGPDEDFPAVGVEFAETIRVTCAG